MQAGCGLHARDEAYVRLRLTGSGMEQADTAQWPAEIHKVLGAHAVRQVAYVPDAGHKELIVLCGHDSAMKSVPLTTEEEGIALLAGAWLGGERGVLLLQSSGVGNCINMLSLARTCRFPLLMLVTMRGQWGEFNPWQVPMGQATPAVLREMGALVFDVERREEIGETVNAAARMVFNGPGMAVVLISQRVLGAKTFGR
jgi:sulfopyruvate decarboxylase alpha subunit